jgi:hypothetical protein
LLAKRIEIGETNIATPSEIQNLCSSAASARSSNSVRAIPLGLISARVEIPGRQAEFAGNIAERMLKRGKGAVISGIGGWITY